jgi:hypothetical protein
VIRSKNHHSVFISVTAESLVEGMADGQKIAEIIIRDAMNPNKLPPDRLNGMRIAAAQSFFPAGSSSHLIRAALQPLSASFAGNITRMQPRSQLKFPGCLDRKSFKNGAAN